MTDQTADLLDRHNIPSQATNVVLAEIDLDLSTFHQVRGQDVDRGHVDRLTDGYLRGDQFPPLIIRHVDGRLTLVGGMHRTHAALAAGVETHPAHLVDVDDHTARLLAVEDNARHGLPLLATEARRQAALLVDEGSTIEEAAAAVRISRTAVGDEVTVQRATRRAANLGCFEAWAVLVRPTKNPHQVSPPRRAVVLAAIDDDVCFAAAAELVANRGLQAKTVHALVDRLAKIPDRAERLAEIGDLDDQGGGYTGASGTYNVHRGDDSDTVRLTNALIDLCAVDVEQAVTGLRGRDSVDRTDRRLTDAGKKIVALGHALDRRKRAGR